MAFDWKRSVIQLEGQVYPIGAEVIVKTRCNARAVIQYSYAQAYRRSLASSESERNQYSLVFENGHNESWFGLDDLELVL